MNENHLMYIRCILYSAAGMNSEPLTAVGAVFVSSMVIFDRGEIT